MGQEDYLKKQIDQLGKVLGKILADLLGLKNNAQVGDAVEATNQALKTELDLSIDELLEIPHTKLIETLVQQKDMNNEHLDQLAEVLLQLAVCQPERESSFQLHALTIMEYLKLHETTYSIERDWKIRELKGKLEW